MNVLHICQDLSYVGGSEIYAIELIKHQISDNKHSVYLAQLDGSLNPFANVDGGILPKESILNLRSLTGRNNIFSRLLALYKYAKVNKIDIIHCHLFPAEVFGAVVSLLTGIKCITTKYCMIADVSLKGSMFQRYLWRPFINKIVDLAVTARFDLILATSFAVLKKYRSSGAKIVYSPCTPITEEMISFEMTSIEKEALRTQIGVTGKTVFVCVARLVAIKGHQFLIDAFMQLTDEKAVLVLVGDGDEKKALQGRCVADKRVIFLGARNDVQRILHISDIFVLPSISESLPLAIQEALAAGLPIIATKVGGVEELVLDQENGILCKSKNSKCLALAMKNLLSLQDTRVRFGKKSRIVAKGLIREKFFQEIDIEYDRLYEERKK